MRKHTYKVVENKLNGKEIYKTTTYHNLKAKKYPYTRALSESKLNQVKNDRVDITNIIALDKQYITILE